jgi:hypothetical protein
MMQPLGDMRDHFQKMIKMSKACGVDLSSALDQSKISVDAYADMVTACRGCGHVGQCDRQLAAMPVLDQAPDYCVNRDEFAALKW